MKGWQGFFMRLAEVYASKSKDPSTKVGCVVVDRRNRQVGQGYNGFAARVNDTKDRLNDREVKLKLTLHSEINAILTSNHSFENCTIYCTHPPCCQCASALIQVGIKRVICYEPEKEFKERWNADMELAKTIYNEADVIYLEIKKEE